jgi:hypothetical protein
MNAFFSSKNGKVIVRMRAEGDGRMIGDMIKDIGKGESFYGLSYDDLLREGAGEIAFKNGRGMIVT